MVIKNKEEMPVTRIKDISCGALFKTKRTARSRNRGSEFGYYIKVDNKSANIDINNVGIFGNYCLGLNVETGQLRVFYTYEECTPLRSEIILK